MQLLLLRLEPRGLRAWLPRQCIECRRGDGGGKRLVPNDGCAHLQAHGRTRHHASVDGGAIVCCAARALQPGDTVSFNYNSTSGAMAGSVQQRRACMLEAFGFVCGCERCVAEGGEVAAGDAPQLVPQPCVVSNKRKFTSLADIAMDSRLQAASTSRVRVVDGSSTLNGRGWARRS